MRGAALYTLGCIRDALAAAAAVDSADVAVLLTNGDAHVRRFVLQALGSTWQAAALHIGAILPLLHDEDAAVRCAALKALGNTGEATAHIEVIIPCLQDVEMRHEALRALGDIGHAASPYIADINALLDQNSSAVLVLETLAKISVKAARAAAVSGTVSPLARSPCAIGGSQAPSPTLAVGGSNLRA